jgi:restriction system protein
MAEFPFHRRAELMRGLFEILYDANDSLRAVDALTRLRARMPATPFEASEYARGGSRYEKLIRFTTIPFVKTGWMVKENGRWYITEEGREALSRQRDPDKFLREAQAGYRRWKEAQPDGPLEEPLGDDEEGGVREAAVITMERAAEEAWATIERHLLTMPPYEFQELVAALLRAMGYHVGWVAPPGKDGGVDIVAFNDPLGTRPPRIKVQVKRQQGRVNVDGLRSFMAILGADDVGIFVNAGGFTKDAEDEARGQHSRRVTLVGLERLVDLWTEHLDKLGEAARRRLPLEPVYFLAPER